MRRSIMELNPTPVDKTGNEVNVLYPVRSKWGVWSFTDPEVQLYSEPFVGDINKMIDMFTDGEEKCLVYISENPLPNSTGHLIKTEGDGNYELEGTGIEGWLCPAMLKYFRGYVNDIYFRIELLTNEPNKGRILHS